MKKIGFYSFRSDSNSFIATQKSLLQKMGYQVVELYPDHSVKTVLRRTRETPLIFFHWLENGNSKHYFQWLFLLFVLRLRGIKLVPFFHNKGLHNGSEAKKLVALIFYRFLLRISAATVLLSQSSKQYLQLLAGKKVADRVFYIPHSNYINDYPLDPPDTVNRSRDKMRVLHTGLLKPYKNLEIILALSKQFAWADIEFVIHGYFSNPKYRENIESQAAELPNVQLIPEYIPEEQLPWVVSGADLLLLPYNVESAMNSGVAILAFSNRKRVLAPAISTVLEYPEDLNYLYRYSTPQQHLEQLSEQLLKAYTEWNQDRVAFAEKGDILYHLVEIQNSPEKVIAGYTQLFQSLFPPK